VDFGEEMESGFTRLRLDEASGFRGQSLLSDGGFDGMSDEFVVCFSGGFGDGSVESGVRELAVSFG